jgi:hypothetical protein
MSSGVWQRQTVLRSVIAVSVILFAVAWQVRTEVAFAAWASPGSPTALEVLTSGQPRSTGSSNNPMVGIAESGDAVVYWQQGSNSNAYNTAFNATSGAWSSGNPISSGNRTGVALSDNGWSHQISVGGGSGGRVILGSDNPGLGVSMGVTMVTSDYLRSSYGVSGHIATDAAGNAVAIWCESRNQTGYGYGESGLTISYTWLYSLKAALFDASTQTWTHAGSINDDVACTSLDVAANRSGDAVIKWASGPSVKVRRVDLTTRQIGTTEEVGSSISDAGTRYDIPIDVAADGTMLVAWITAGSPRGLAAARFDGATWSSPDVVATSGWVEQVRGTAGAQGQAAIVWVDNDRLVESHLTGGSNPVWSAPARLGTRDPWLAVGADMDAAGNAIAVYTEEVTGDVYSWRFRAADRQWGAPTLMFDAGAYSDLMNGHVRLAEAGRGVAVWSASDGTYMTVRAATFGPPDAPTAATATPGDSSAVVSWQAPFDEGASSITGYTVTSSPGGRTCSWTTGPATCTVTGLDNGTAYTFAVRATNGIGTGAASSASAAVVARTTPDAPTSVVGAPGNEQVAVSWSAPGSNGGAVVTGYTVTATPGGRTCSSTSVAPATPSMTCVVTGLVNGTSYTFRVEASNIAGAGGASVASGIIVPRTTPGVATGVIGTAGNAQVSVAWTPAPNGGASISQYTVTASPGGQQCSWSSGPLECTVSGLTNGTAYTFTVVAANAAGSGSVSAASGNVTPRTTPGQPTGVSATAGNTQALVQWTAPVSTGGDAISGYTVTATPGGQQCSWSSGPLRCTVSGLTNGNGYTFTVAAVNGAGTGASSTATATITPRALPGVPTNVVTTHGNGTIAVTWAAPASDGGSAIVSYSATADPGGRACQWTTGALGCTITGLTNGSAYTVTVVATSGAGNSLPSDVSAASTPRTVAGAPTGVIATAGNGNATVSWQAPNSNGGAAITSYTVASTTDSQTCVWVGGPLTCTVTGLTNGRVYTFTVTAGNSEGSSAAALAVAAVVPSAPSVAQAAPTIPAVTSLKVEMSGISRVRISYKPGTTGAEHRASCVAAGGKSVSEISTTSQIVADGLTYGKSYVCDVVSVRDGISSTVASVRVALLAELPRPAGMSPVFGARSGTSLATSWTKPKVPGWVRISQRVELRTGGGAIVAKTNAKIEGGKARASVAVPRSADTGTYSLCVVFQDARAQGNAEEACKKIRVTRPSSNSGGGGGGGASPSKPSIGPIVL